MRTADSASLLSPKAHAIYQEELNEYSEAVSSVATAGMSRYTDQRGTPWAPCTIGLPSGTQQTEVLLTVGSSLSRALPPHRTEPAHRVHAGSCSQYASHSLLPCRGVISCTEFCSGRGSLGSPVRLSLSSLSLSLLRRVESPGACTGGSSPCCQRPFLSTLLELCHLSWPLGAKEGRPGLPAQRPHLAQQLLASQS